MKSKSKLIGLTSLVITIILLVGIGMYMKNANNMNVKIEGVKIDKDEYIRAMNSKKYEVTQYFIKKYGAKITKDFWGKEFQGEYPYKMLADSTIDELLRIHAVYELAKEKGHVNSVEYNEFIQRLNNKNDSRKEDIKNGKTIYGLSNYTEDIFLEYEMDQLQKAYCSDTNNEGMKISLEDGKKYYEDNKEASFQKNDDFELSYVKVYYTALGLSEKEVKAIKDKMIDISKKIDSNNSLLALAENDEILKEYFSKEIILSSEVSAKAKTIGDVLDISMKLNQGDTTQVIDENGCLYLIQCIKRIDYDYVPYEEVKDNINKALREDRYNDIITKHSKDLEVSENIKSVYKFTEKYLK